MSSFAMMTQTGPPELLVEIGDPISSDPVMLSGLFQAIVALSNEVTNAPVQVIQSNKFTIRFKYLEGELAPYLLIIGSTSNIYGIDVCVSHVENIIKNGKELGLKEEELTPKIKGVLKTYLGETTGLDDDDQVGVFFRNLKKDYIKLIIWGVLSGYRFKYPHTHSLDFNRDIDQIFKYLGQEFEESGENVVIEFMLDGGFCKLSNQIYKRAKDVLPSLRIVDELVGLVKRKKFSEFRARLENYCDILATYERMFTHYLQSDETEKHNLDMIRYVAGVEMEYFLFQRLERSAPEVVNELRNNTRNLEWIHTW